jgi:hypothetical protein
MLKVKLFFTFFYKNLLKFKLFFTFCGVGVLAESVALTVISLPQSSLTWGGMSGLHVKYTNVERKYTT